MSYCKHLIDGQCSLPDIDISLGEECGAEFASCNNYKEVGRIYGYGCNKCHTMYTAKDDIIITSCGCGKNSRSTQ